MRKVAESQLYEFGDFRLDEGKRLLFDGNDEIFPLMPKAFETLLYLVANSGRLIEKEELMSAIWADIVVEESNLIKNISILRRVLGETIGDHRYIVTVPGKGYKFVAAVRRVERKGTSGALTKGPTRQRNARPWKSNALPFLAFVILGVSAGWYVWPSPEQIEPPRSLHTIAILPFRPLVADHRDEFLEMGMADTLISALGNRHDVIVRPLSSVRRFGGLDQDPIQAGRSLRVDSVLEGNIQRWGDTIRVNVRLIKVENGAILWAETFEEEFTHIFVVQDAIASSVVTALARRLNTEERPKFEKRYTASAEAYTFYIRGRHHLYKVTEPEVRKSISYFEQAIVADPNFALAYAEMADAYKTLAIAAFAPPTEVCPQSRSLAEKALALDETLAEAHIVLGWVGFLCEWDWGMSEREFKRALELSPNNSDAHRGYAHMLSNSGRHDEAIVEGRIARELGPLTLITAALEGQFLFFAGRNDEAIDRVQQTIELEPNFWVARIILARIYFRQGRVKEAVQELEIAGSHSREGTVPDVELGYAFAISGEPQLAEAIITELESESRSRFVPSYAFAMIYNGLGERTKALDYLEKAASERESGITFIRIDTRWDSFRSEPRFNRIIEQMNFGDGRGK